MPPLLTIFAVAGAVLIVVAILPQLEVRMPRRYRDIIYVRLRRNGGRIDVWRGKPVAHATQFEFEWDDQQRSAFDADGLPLDVQCASLYLRRMLRKSSRRFPFAPIIILHPIDKAMGGLAPQDRRKLDELGVELGDQVLIGNLPNAFPERAFHELRENGLGAWGEN